MQTNDIWFQKVDSLGGVLDVFATILSSSMFSVLTVLNSKKKRKEKKKEMPLTVQEEAGLIPSGREDILNSISFTGDCRKRT